MKFGPYEWLRLDDEAGGIFDSTGEVVAWRDGNAWRVPTKRGGGMRFDGMTITTSPEHPHSSCGRPEWLAMAHQRLAQLRSHG